MVYCTKCGKQNPDTAKFCTSCGLTLERDMAIETPVSIAQKNKPASNTKKWWMAGIISAVTVGIGAYFLLADKKQTSDTTDNTTVDPPAIPTAPTNNWLNKAAITAFIDQWLLSQNNKNMATYSGFYGSGFSGIKRVKSGQAYTYNRQEWINDRTKMYNSARNLAVTVSDIKIAENNGTSATVIFTYSYSSNAYRDIGTKRLNIEKNTSGKILILREEMLNSQDPDHTNIQASSYTEREAKLVYQSDCYVIITGSFSYETDAKNEVKRIRTAGHSNTGYLWIPDYPSLSGKSFFAPFIGLFQTYQECEKNLRSLTRTGMFWYGVKVSYSPERVEIRI